MNDKNTPEGVMVLYDLLVKASEFPGESSRSVRQLYQWGQKLKALHHMLSSYHDEEYLKEFRALRTTIIRISKYYPSERYLSEGYDALFEWLGSISRLYARLGMLISMDYSYTEGGEEGI